MSRMKRIVRWIRNLYLALSLLLFAAVLVLWHRSYHADHSMWRRWQLRHDSTRLRTDCFVCDRGRVSWSCREELTWSSPNDRTIWRSYSRPANAGGWNYRFETTSKTWPNLAQRLRRIRVLGFEFAHFGPISGQQPVYDKSGFEIAAPCSVLTVFFGIPPVMRFLRLLRRYRRRASNRCPACGYDIRATPDYCPECGQKITA